MRCPATSIGGQRPITPRRAVADHRGVRLGPLPSGELASSGGSRRMERLRRHVKITNDADGPRRGLRAPCRRCCLL